jgi:transcriptional regulator with XRE-family HTH domain
MAALGGVALRTYSNYETGTSEPSVRILANWHEAGADVLYLVTGQHAPGLLSPEEDVALAGFRRLDVRGRAGVLALIGGLSGAAAEAPPVKAGKRSQIIVGGSNNVQVARTKLPIKAKRK